ncbi:MAG: hypothetical protein GF383_06395 [Candidatus Lokiarchaeota archaeon]|nr:hypothetical protein [Candidatus Lokiarchaeota archaeon]MBD3339666.1 hypothetical protein [Candidatus Lokiarchaeota archaeon]
MMEDKDTTWNSLLKDFIDGIEVATNQLEKRDIDNIPGAKDALIQRLNTMKTQFPKNNGEIFYKSIDDKIQNSFFPDTRDFADAFKKILKSRTHEQDFVINELLNGFVASRTKAIASGTQVPVIDRLVEAFSKRNDFHIVDHQFYAMFGDPNKPRKYVKEHLKELVNLFGLISKELMVEKDLRKSEKKIYIFYTFPDEILRILEEKYIIIDEELGHAYVSEEFDRNVFICMFLANLSINRDNPEKIGGSYTINGISAIFALILLLSFMPKLSIEETHPILRDSSFESSNMSVIPKSWMMKQVIEPLFEPLIKIIAYRLGGGLWLSNVIDSEINKKIHSQIRFLLKDVNRWVLGELVRVEIPIFVEIANIFAEITVGTDSEAR